MPSSTTKMKKRRTGWRLRRREIERREVGGSSSSEVIEAEPVRLQWENRDTLHHTMKYHNGMRVRPAWRLCFLGAFDE